MENWLIFAIANIFLSGLHNFSMKIAAEKKYDISIINLYSYAIWIIILWTYLLFNITEVSFNNIYIIILLAFWNWLLFFLSMFSRVESMKNIDTVIFFPLYKTFWPIIVTIISVSFFKEILSIKEIIWIILWIIVPLLLITNSEKKRQKNLYVWVMLVLITAILTAFSSSMLKEARVQEYSIVLLLLFSSIFWLLFSIISYKYLKKKKMKFNKKWIKKFSIISGFLHLLSFVTFTLALKWNLAIVFTIWSFSILIPIVLSIIFYKDHFNLKKWLVIILSIISIILFI